MTYEFTNEYGPDTDYNQIFVLNVNKSDCKMKTSLGKDCTCYGYPDYFIGIRYNNFSLTAAWETHGASVQGPEWRKY